MGLQYDDSAFYYFLLSALSLYLVPSYYHIGKALYNFFLPKSAEKLGAVARTNLEKKKSKRIREKVWADSEIFKRSFVVNATATVLLTILSVWLVMSLNENSEIASFDPYEILNIDRDTETKGIKAAYRKMSLIYHPDKNPDNPSAQATFMLIAKAYEALTDPVAKKNWEEYGNPDGKQSLEVSIGLPTFLLDGQFRNVILLSYLFGMVVLVPLAVWIYYSNSSKYGEMNIMYKTWGWLNHALGENCTSRNLPEVLAGCAEFHELLMPKDMKEEAQEMAKLEKQVKPKMVRPKYTHILVVKGNYLLHAHLTRVEVKGAFKKQLDHILINSSNLTTAMVEHCHQRMWLKPAKEVINFIQRLTQCVWDKESSFMQLPYFTEKEANIASKGKNNFTLRQYIALPDEEKKGLKDFTEDQKADILAACQIIPNVTVDIKTFVQDDEDNKIYANDMITVRVNITRNNVADGETAGLVHAPHFPVPRKESWWIVLATKEGKIVAIENVSDQEKSFHHDIKFMAPPEGGYNMEVHVLSNDYVSLDQVHSVTFKVLNPNLLPEYKAHKEDMELDEEPTMFEQMMAGNIEEDSDDDSDSDSDSDADNEGAKGGGGAGAKKAEEDSDSDSDDDDIPKLVRKDETKKDK